MQSQRTSNVTSWTYLFSLFSVTRLRNTQKIVLSRCRLLINVTNGVKLSYHNIIQIHKNVMGDWQYFGKIFYHSDWMWEIFHIILLVPQNILMDLNNVLIIEGIKNTCNMSFNIYTTSLSNIDGMKKKLIFFKKITTRKRYKYPRKLLK